SKSQLPTPKVQAWRLGIGSWELTDLLRQRIRPHLESNQLARRALAALHVERRARRDRRVDALALPASLRIVDAPVHSLREEPHRVGHAQREELAVDEREQPFGQ